MQLHFNSLTDLDIANICLQRTDILFHYSDEGRRIFNQWHNHNKLSPLLSFVEDNLDIKQAIISDWLATISGEYNQIKTGFPEDMGFVCDIGCGYALLDLLLYCDYGSELTLIDIELTKTKKHLFHKEIFAGYSSNVSAYNLLIENKVKAQDVHLINPIMNELPKDKIFDVIFSSLSLGFHYPLKTYEDFIVSTLKMGGSLIFDHRIGSDDITIFTKRFENVRFADSHSKKGRKVYCSGFLG